MRRLAADLEFRKAGDLFMLLRVAVTGRKETPPLHPTLVALGRDAVLRRIDAALEAMNAE